MQLINERFESLKGMDAPERVCRNFTKGENSCRPEIASEYLKPFKNGSYSPRKNKNMLPEGQILPLIVAPNEKGQIFLCGSYVLVNVYVIVQIGI